MKPFRLPALLLASYSLLLFSLSNPAFAQTWARTYGGASDDWALSIQQTTDGGYVVAGYTISFDAGSRDFWVLKLDALGDVSWQKSYGGALIDDAFSIQQTTDGGFVVAGWTGSFGAGNSDLWVLKLDASGNVAWQKTYGGASGEFAYSIEQTTDGGYVVAGDTGSFGAGNGDLWVLKLDASGNVQWQKTYDGASGDSASSIQQTTDGGYVVAGTTFFGAGGANFWILKLDASGNVQWQKTYGGASDDYATSIQQTTDCGFIVTGQTYSFGAGINDFWVLKLDASGNISWQKSYGGAWDDWAWPIQQTTDGGYVVAGDTGSFSAGIADFWILKLDASGNVSWQKTYGGASGDGASSIQQTTDGGYIVAGGTLSFGAGGRDFWVLKLDASGNIDASCTFIADTLVAGVDSTATVTDTTATVTNTTVTPADTTATVTDTTAAVAEQCYGCTADAFEPDGNCYVTKSVILGGEVQSHNFCDNTEDWISFNACTGRSYMIETSNLGAKANTVLELYGTDCTTLLDSDDNGGSGKASLINWTAPADGTYHIKVLQFGGKSGNDRGYDLTLTGDTLPCALWARTYGGADLEESYSARVTSDGGFIITGIIDIDSSQYDFLVLKLDAAGDLVWKKTYGGGNYEFAYSVVETSDGGFAVGGITESFGAGNEDFWILKLSSSGLIQWQQTYGGVGWDRFASLQTVSDGGFVVTGRTNSFGTGSDAWVLKLDSLGSVEWQKVYDSYNYANSILETAEGGFVVVGSIGTNPPGTSFLVFRLDSSGSLLWGKSYGNLGASEAFSIAETSDGGFVVAGITECFTVKNCDFWVLKLDAAGTVLWQKSYGGADWDSPQYIIETSDLGFVVAGYTESFGYGGYDFWVLKLSATGAIEWQNTYGDMWDQEAYQIQQAPDTGFFVSGLTQFHGMGWPGDFWLLKMDSSGNIDPSCTFIADTTATPVDTTATVTCTTVTPVDTTATVTNTTVTPVITSATMNEQCAWAAPPPSPGAVPDGGAVPGTPLMVADAGGGAVTLTWSVACNATDYAVMAGDLATLGSGYNHAPSVCTDAGGDLTETIAPAGATLYFLVVPHNGASEGSYGTDSAAVERPPAAGACHAQSIGSCP